jgi:UDP-N-acetylglucosamine 2-epimerase (non-hydrolysing)
VKVMVAFGTRPEAIKLAPVIQELRRRDGVEVHVVTTAQHRELLDQALQVFAIVADTDLAIMRPGQTLAELSGRLLPAIDRAIVDVSPDLVLVQGDTSSAFICALAGFYRQVRVGHVEAGLRSGCAADPFPEEMNRRLTSVIASIHFAPTVRARDCLLAEGISAADVFLTGNTIVDALKQVRGSRAFAGTRMPIDLAAGRRLVLVTLHRRESWGTVLEAMCQALAGLVRQFDDIEIVVPVHLNPAVRATLEAKLGGVDRVTLLPSLDYLSFLKLVEASWIVMTDSGGVQEEAPSFGKPVLVLRRTTERPEAIDAGVSRLVGTTAAGIGAAAGELLSDQALRAQMARIVSPFGDGRASVRIADIITADWHTAARIDA